MTDVPFGNDSSALGLAAACNGRTRTKLMRIVARIIVNAYERVVIEGDNLNTLETIVGGTVAS
jgi:hypothetical protein